MSLDMGISPRTGNICSAQQLCRRLLAIVFFCVVHPGIAGAASSPSGFESWSTGDTLRVDIFHAGTAADEKISLDELRHEGSWPGSRSQLIDSSNLGDYLVEVLDLTTGVTIYSRGIDSCFDANDAWSGCFDTVRVPFPRQKVRIRFNKRYADNNGFYNLSEESFDPITSPIKPSDIPATTVIDTIMEGGPSEIKVDIVLLGDGYKASQKAKLQSDARRAATYLFTASPFKELKASLNFRSVFVASVDSGITNPTDGYFAKTAYSCTYNVGGVERDIGCLNNRAVHDTTAVVPYDFIIILANSGRYGGSARYQGHATLSIDSAQAEYLVQHEFGHAFGGLADEYYSFGHCDVQKTAEPWRPNVTRNLDRSSLKWRDQIDPKTAVPTPWHKAEYDHFDSEFLTSYFALRTRRAPERDVDALIAKSVPKAVAILETAPDADKIGAFEGADGNSCGVFRPQSNCIMFTLSPRHFCSVCAKAIRRATSLYDH